MRAGTILGVQRKRRNAIRDEEIASTKDAADYASLFELLISSEEKNKGKGR
jgi:hypothetical protein